MRAEEGGKDDTKTKVREHCGGARGARQARHPALPSATADRGGGRQGLATSTAPKGHASPEATRAQLNAGAARSRWPRGIILLRGGGRLVAGAFGFSHTAAPIGGRSL